MPANSRRLQLIIDQDYDPEGPVSQFAALHSLLDALVVKKDKTDVGVRLNPPPSSPPARRGRPPKDSSSGNGTDSATGTGSADVLGQDAAQDEGEDAELGMPQASGLTGAEAKEQALGLCRVIYDRGHKETITDMRKKLGVALFNDIPPDKGHEFLKMAEAAAAKHGMRV